jgi:hypothetical protein
LRGASRRITVEDLDTAFQRWWHGVRCVPYRWQILREILQNKWFKNSKLFLFLMLSGN